jgi:flagellar hook-basal body complex protein FliE
MAIDSIRAAQSYADAIRVARGAQSTDEMPAARPAAFASLVQSAIAETSGALRAGEQAAASVAAGEASLVDVATAVSAAEVSLETAIAVRNKVVEAYLEIMRMPI